MTPHKFQIGQTVQFVENDPNRGSAPRPTGNFRIVMLMPDYLGNNQYRIESTRDNHQRVVVESEISL